jgi:hypothetical protein
MPNIAKLFGRTVSKAAPEVGSARKMVTSKLSKTEQEYVAELLSDPMRKGDVAAMVPSMRFRDNKMFIAEDELDNLETLMEQLRMERKEAVVRSQSDLPKGTVRVNISGKSDMLPTRVPKSMQGRRVRNNHPMNPRRSSTAGGRTLSPGEEEIERIIKNITFGDE